MSEQHSIEPWHQCADGDCSCGQILGPESVYIAKAKHCADARRIVACVNACKGLDTEGLENMLAIGRNFRSIIDDATSAELKGTFESLELRAQRDYLLKVLELMVEYHVPKVNPLSDAAERSGRGAIAAIKEGVPMIRLDPDYRRRIGGDLTLSEVNASAKN